MKIPFIKGTKNRKSIFYILSVMIICMMVLLITVTTTIFTYIYNKSLIKNAITSSLQVTNQVANTIDIYYSEIRSSVLNLSNEISLDTDIDEINAAISSMMNNRSDIKSIIIYDLNGDILSYAPADLKLKVKAKNNLSFDKELFDSTNGVSITPPHVQDIFEGSYPWVATVAKKEYSSAYKQYVYVTVDMNFSTIAEYVDNVGIGNRGYCYILDQDGLIAYHPQQQLIFSGIRVEDTKIISELSDGFIEDSGKIYAVKAIKGGWKAIGVSYTKELMNASTGDVVSFLVAVIFLGLIITGAVFFVINRMVLNPVRRLSCAMKKFEKDTENFTYSEVGGVSEINDLGLSFDHMVERIKELMEKIKNEEITLRKTELKALQAQINPHFLYNTLDSILWMCERDQSKDAVEMVSALAKLFRISINRGNEMVTIEKEINHAKSYILIQSYRYKDKFEYSFDIDEDILSYVCNKITLQPIIENAINHGIGDMGEGKIIITAKSDGDDILFTVADNGVGMTKEKCDEILFSSSSGSSNGIGLKNVSDRIKIYFGSKYGITIDSVLDEGTTVYIRFPKTKGTSYDL